MGKFGYEKQDLSLDLKSCSCKNICNLNKMRLLWEIVAYVMLTWLKLDSQSSWYSFTLDSSKCTQEIWQSSQKSCIVRRAPPKPPFSCYCAYLLFIVKLDWSKTHIFLLASSNTPKNATFGYCMQKLQRVKVLFGRGSKFVSSTWV